MSIEEKRGKLKDYVDRNFSTLAQFARYVNIPKATLWKIYQGKVVPRKRTAKKIVVGTKGVITEKDLGIE